jgi:hypothetical protein
MKSAIKEKKTLISGTERKSRLTVILFIINTKAGTGYSSSDIAELIAFAALNLGRSYVLYVKETDNHKKVTEITEAFLSASYNRKIIIAGGGGGTLSAVITGIYNKSGRVQITGDSLRVAALRMGSGNVLAKKLGIHKNSYEGMRQIIDGIKNNVVKKVCVGRFDFTGSNLSPRTVFGSTLMGFGEFGKVPGAISRFHKKHPVIHRCLAKLSGVEFLTTCEYVCLLVIRSLFRLISTERIRSITISMKGQSFSKKIISGFVMNFPVKAIPVNPGIGLSDEALFFYAVPYTKRLDLFTSITGKQKGRPVSFLVTKDQPVSIGFGDAIRTPAEFFIDEDPFFAQGTITISVAGMLDFITGTENRSK